MSGCQCRQPVCYCNQRKRYGFWSFIFDAFMAVFTGGLWLIWIFVREMRGQR